MLFRHGEFSHSSGGFSKMYAGVKCIRLGIHVLIVTSLPQIFVQERYIVCECELKI